MTRITALDPYRKPAPPGGAFAALTWPQQQAASHWLWKFTQRWGTDLPPWRRGILTGVAKRLALNPPDSAWARRMLAKRGGLAVQEKYKREGINPTAKATAARLGKLQTNAPEPQRRAGAVYTLPPGVLPRTNFDESRFAALSLTSMHGRKKQKT
jgi:hypothetical protein